MEYFKAIKAQAELHIDKMTGTDMERKVKTATSAENWPTPQSQLYDIAQATFHYDLYREVMPLLWKRMHESDLTKWRIVYKCLVLLESLLKHGSDRVIEECRERQYELKGFLDYRHYEGEKDRGAGIRDKTKEIMELLKDENALRQIRQTAAANKDKYVGVSNSGSVNSYGNTGRGGYDNGGGDRFGNNSGGGYGNDRYDSGRSPTSPYGQDSRGAFDENEEPVETEKKKKKDKKKGKKKGKKEEEEAEPEDVAPPSDLEEEEVTEKKSKKKGKKGKKGKKTEEEFGETEEADDSFGNFQPAQPQYSQPPTQPSFNAGFDSFDSFGSSAQPAAFGQSNAFAQPAASNSMSQWDNFDGSASAASHSNFSNSSGGFDVFGGGGSQQQQQSSSGDMFFGGNSAPAANEAGIFDSFASAPAPAQPVSRSGPLRGRPGGDGTPAPQPVAVKTNSADLAWDTGLVNLNLGGPAGPAAKGPAGISQPSVHLGSRGKSSGGGMGAFDGLGLPTSGGPAAAPAIPSMGMNMMGGMGGMQTMPGMMGGRPQQQMGGYGAPQMGYGQQGYGQPQFNPAMGGGYGAPMGGMGMGGMGMGGQFGGMQPRAPQKPAADPNSIFF